MRPYFYSVNEYIKDTYGVKMYKIALNGGMTCPNRDGLIDTKGCIFCSAGGSGDFAGDAVYKKCNPAAYEDSVPVTGFNGQLPAPLVSIDKQIEAGKALISSKYNGNDFIGYFQSYTNTYAPYEYLEQLFTHCINRDDIRILSIATRPDCLDPKIISLLARLNQIKPVWVELGLQTVNPDTAHFIRRGYELNVYDTAIKMLKEAGIYTIVHMIAGLPGESQKDYLNTAKYISSSGADGIKIALLHVLKGTDLAACYYNNEFQIMSMDEYISTLAEIIQILPQDMAIHRITGDGPKNLLIAPLWSSNKKLVYNSIIKYFRENDIHQGRLYR